MVENFENAVKNLRMMRCCVGRTNWNIDDIMKLLETLIETYFKIVDGKILSHLQEFICIGLRRVLFTIKITH